MKKSMAFVITLCTVMLVGYSTTLQGVSADTAGQQNGFAAQAKQAILIEPSTGRVLYEKNADEEMVPSSMTKILAVIPVFERLKEGRLQLSDKLPVSENAWRQEGSRMFLEPNTMVSIEDLLRGIIVQSGNDATTVLAEGIGGNEANFAEEMNAWAQKVGATHSHFKNASGLPEEGQYSTARDMAIISQYLVENYPQFYPLFAERDFRYNNIKQGNRNPLLYKTSLKADGIKTGNSNSGGFGMVGSATQNGMRLIVVVNGTSSMNERSKASEQLLLWGFREFKKQRLFEAGQVVGDAKVWLGRESTVPLVVPENIDMVLSMTERKNMQARIAYHNPVEAPLKEGDKIGTLTLLLPDKFEKTYPLVAGKSVGEVGVFGRVASALNYVIWGTSQ